MPEQGETYRAGPPAAAALGPRLLAAAGLVRPGRAVADIGTDHGKLPVWLALRGVSPRVLAVDSRPLPLARARALVRQTGCEGAVDCRLGEGLAALAEGEAEEIVVAGLSGETTIEILAGCGWLKRPQTHLVLVPASRHHRLRRWLCQNGFEIRQEVLAQEKGRAYTALSAFYTGRAQAPTPFFCLLGLVPQSPGPAARQYVSARLADLRRQALAPLAGAQRAELESLTEEVEACLRSLT